MKRLLVKPKASKPRTVAALPITIAMEMHAQGLAKFVGAEIVLTAKGRKFAPAEAKGITFVIEGLHEDAQNGS